MQDYNDLFYLIYQPIVNIKNNGTLEILEYEVLLRSQDKRRFPNKEFNEILFSPEKHQMFMKWYFEKLNDILVRNKNINLAINIHPLQWKEPIIFDFFYKLKEFSNRIKIELTEHRNFIEFDLDTVFKSRYAELVMLGYNFVIDDVGNGTNDIDFVIKHIEQVSSIKFSILPFRDIKKETLILFIEAWFHLAKEFDKEFVVEGIECKILSSYLLNMGIRLQQGFLFGEGKSHVASSK